MESAVETPFDTYMKKLADQTREELEHAIAWRRGRAAWLLREAEALENGGYEEGKAVYDKNGRMVE